MPASSLRFAERCKGALSACGRSTWSNTATPCSNDSKAAKSKAVRTRSVTSSPAFLDPRRVQIDEMAADAGTRASAAVVGSTGVHYMLVAQHRHVPQHGRGLAAEDSAAPQRGGRRPDEDRIPVPRRQSLPLLRPNVYALPDRRSCPDFAFRARSRASWPSRARSLLRISSGRSMPRSWSGTFGRADRRRGRCGELFRGLSGQARRYQTSAATGIRAPHAIRIRRRGPKPRKTGCGQRSRSRKPDAGKREPRSGTSGQREARSGNRPGATGAALRQPSADRSCARRTRRRALPSARRRGPGLDLVLRELHLASGSSTTVERTMPSVISPWTSFSPQAP